MQPQDSVTVGLAGGYDELPVGKSFDHLPEGTKQCMFWGVGSDGLEQGEIRVVGANTPLYGQGSFFFSNP